MSSAASDPFEIEMPQQQQPTEISTDQLIDFGFNNDDSMAADISSTPNFNTLNIENNNLSNLNNNNLIDSNNLITQSLSSNNNNNITMLVASDSHENRGEF